MSAFQQAFTIVIGTEGGFTADPADPGNWTGAACGQGECRGTKFGISAAAYPALDIAAITKTTAATIYKRDYWDKLEGDRLPPPLALIVFDAAVNAGVARSIRWLQTALGIAADGIIGAVTLDHVDAVAMHPQGGADLAANVLAERLRFMAALPTWPHFAPGWSRRLCRLPFQAITITGA